MALYLMLLLCIWAILAIQLKIPHLTINVAWSQERCNNLNLLYINLSYSFLAGYIFYLLTISFPKKIEKKRLKPIIKQKVLGIWKGLWNIMLEFSRDVDVKNYMETENASKVLMSKKWSDNIPMFQNLYNAKISYIAFISLEGETIRNNITNFIQSYQSYISAEQICLLEELYNMPIFNQANQLSRMQILIEDENAIKSLANMMIEALEKMTEIENSFSIKIN